MSVKLYLIVLCFVTYIQASEDALDRVRIAVHDNNMPALRRLLVQHPDLDLNEQMCGTSILSTAITKATPIMIQLLIKHGACIRTREHGGNTPLHIAALFGKVKAMQILLKESADPLAENNEAITPLHYAVSVQNPHVCAELLGHIKNEDVDPQDHKGGTPLMYAIDHGYIQHIKTLLHKGASLDIQNDEGSTPLHIAAKSLDSIQFLLDRGANTHARDKRKATPLHLAACAGKKNCVKELISCSDINAQDIGGTTPLFVSILFNHEDIARLLLRKGANPNIIANETFPPLHVAVKTMPSLVPDLFTYGADPFAQNMGRCLIKQTKNKLTRRYLMDIMRKKQLESCMH